MPCDDLGKCLPAYEIRGTKSQQLLVAVESISPNVIGFQESRNKKCTYKAGGYCCFASGSDRQFLGCDIWISLCKPFVINSSDGTSRSELVEDVEHVRFLFGCPRSCCVSVSLESVTIFVLCIHVPDKNKGQEVIAAFLSSVAANLIKFKVGKRNLILLGDLNHKFGSTLPKCIGSCFPQHQTKSGADVHAFLSKFELFLP